MQTYAEMRSDQPEMEFQHETSDIHMEIGDIQSGYAVYLLTVRVRLDNDGLPVVGRRSSGDRRCNRK
jgi:hypothetical protein